MKKLNIGRDFSLDPYGRFTTDSKSSGEEFRENCLKDIVAALGPDEKLEIILDDGVEGYGSSFLMEGFAGMVKYGYITNSDLLEKLNITYTHPDFKFYKNKIIEYIGSSIYNSKIYEKNSR